MTDLLTLGMSGLRAYTQAMGTVSENIANAQSPGYVRRTISVGETVPAGSETIYARNEASSGYRAVSIDRSVEQWQVNNMRQASSDAQMTASRLTWFEATEDALNADGNGLSSALTGFFNNADALSADPSSTTLRAQFLAGTGQIASAFRRTASALAETAGGISDAAHATANSVNINLESLDRVNKSLLRSAEGSSGRASMLDERDRLLDAINSDIPISIEFGSHGEASVSVSGVAGATLLDGNGAAAIGISTSADGRLGVALPAGGTPLTLISGTLSGLTSASEHVADQRAMLDSFANTVASELNAAHAGGIDANGNSGIALFGFSGTGAMDMTASALAPSDVAAADGSGPSGNLIAMGNLRGSAGAENSWATQVAMQSQATNLARAQNTSASTRQDATQSAYADLSAVDLDREAAELIRFQQAFQASARVIQVARENLQAIFSAF